MRWHGNEQTTIRISNIASVILLFLITGNDPVAQTNGVVDDHSVRTELPASPAVDQMLPAELQNFWKPWHGDFDGMIERRVVRVLTTYGGYQFYYDEGKPRGATYEMVRKLENYLNSELGRGHIRVYVLPIPVSRDQLIPALLAGHGDLIATDLTMTPERQAQIEFTRPLLTDIDEIVVLGAGVANIRNIEDLAGREILIRESSSSSADTSTGGAS